MTPAEVLQQLKKSKRKDDYLVLVVMKNGTQPDGRWYEDIAKQAVGSLYPAGRTRSQAISRARRRGIALGLLEHDRYRLEPTPLGRDTSRLATARSHGRTSRAASRVVRSKDDRQ